MTIGSDADGDVYFRNSNVLTRLAKGDDDQVLTLASGIPSWAAAGGARYFPVWCYTFDTVTGRFATGGTADGSVTLGSGGAVIDSDSAENISFFAEHKDADGVATRRYLYTYVYELADGATSTAVSFVGAANGSGITFDDSSITFTSLDNIGVKHIGDGSNIDWSATNSQGTSETATAIIANVGTNVDKMIEIDHDGTTNAKWYSYAGSVLATHTTNLPDTSVRAFIVITTQTTNVTISAANKTLVN